MKACHDFSASLSVESCCAMEKYVKEHVAQPLLCNQLENKALLDDKVGVSKLFTPPGDQNGAFKAQVEARMMTDASGILVSEK